ncbi:MAG: putative bifunctional diguanylate cyclase/phosphodiesterase [Vulcanimicrobiaceae bacterium]
MLQPAICVSDGYRDLFAHHPQPMWVFEIATLRFLDVNEAACRAYGYSREAFLRMSVPELRPPEDRDFDRFFSHVEKSASTLWRHRRADGSDFYVEVVSSAVIFDGKPARAVVALDATSRLEVARALSESRAALAEAQELTHLGSFEVDLRTESITWSAELYRIVGLDPERELPRWLDEFDHPDDAATVRLEIERARSERTPYSSEHRILTSDGRERNVCERGQFIFEDGEDEPRRIVGAVLDVTDRKQAEERLRHLAQHDALTDLPNRSLFSERLRCSIGRAHTSRNAIAVLFLDLDRFKAINDTIAHAAGDLLLRETAARLSDAVGRHGIVARHSGDEFLVALEGVEHEEKALAFARELLEIVARPLIYEDLKFEVTASIGLSLFPNDGNTPDELLRNADAAMYAAKGRGGDAVGRYSPELRLRAIKSVELERALRQAIERDEIELAYQPIVCARTGALAGFEALARWHHAGETVGPDTFIPLAEETGLIVRLGTSVLEHACREMVRLLPFCSKNAMMNVNISARQFRENGFGACVGRILEQTGLPADRLQLEITESAYISGDAGIRSVTALKELGVALAIDDFGTGYSALGYLKHLPVDALKIDRSFVADILTDAADQAIVRAIIAVAKNLGLGVVAEGVESQEQALLLRRLGCTHLQGYYFSRPLAREELDLYLQTERALP